MTTRRRATASIVLLLVGAVMFEVPGAWLYTRGAPWWAALAAALAAFPVLPVGWHLLGERKRRRAAAAVDKTAKPGLKPKPSALTGGDRFTMRLIAVALVALGPLLFFRHTQALRAVKHHPGWFVPHGPPAPPTIHGDPRLFGQVPADAELVIWARQVDGLGGGAIGDTGGAGRKAKDPEQPKELLIAYRAGDVMLAVRGSDKAFAKLDLQDLNAQLAKQSMLPVKGPLVARRRSADLMVIASEGWAPEVDDRDAGRAPGPEAIGLRLAGAPSDAVVISAAAPSHPVAGLQVLGMQSWLLVSDAGIRVDADFFVADEAARTALVDGFEAERARLSSAVSSECRPRIDSLLRGITITTGDTTVHASAWWRPAQVGEAMMCALGAAMKHADWKQTEHD
ncbi:MAG TPA: hypothetical protein VHE35_29460 [Kofleriaceae bacterium]|nr:hypothetical protein [Kofleriaceae bacterium]